VVERVLRTMTKADPAVAISAFRNYALYEHIPAIEEVAVPVYCINSDLWSTYMLPLRQLSPAAAMTLMPGLGHFPMLEAPEKFQENMITAVNYIVSHYRRH
jgi:pimeloyl-ACP methyl ester carboxylesterase